ncbi:hypothetical protein GCM10009601_36720 [Streptomyces thermospinosisporus]|uniref:Uncharacterized protein n=1 Tax=Streptomyces thermospinosisporus TaxID=161482 RepID=A0ABN1Z0W1_9ACTN
MLASVDLAGPDPLDAVMAHAVAVSFGLGDTTGLARFRRTPQSGGEPLEITWERPWYTNLGFTSDDNEPGGSDGWGSDGGDAGDGGSDAGDGGSDGGGDSGGGDGGEGGGGD